MSGNHPGNYPGQHRWEKYPELTQKDIVDWHLIRTLPQIALPPGTDWRVGKQMLVKQALDNLRATKGINPRQAMKNAQDSMARDYEQEKQLALAAQESAFDKAKAERHAHMFKQLDRQEEKARSAQTYHSDVYRQPDTHLPPSQRGVLGSRKASLADRVKGFLAQHDPSYKWSTDDDEFYSNVKDENAVNRQLEKRYRGLNLSSRHMGSEYGWHTVPAMSGGPESARSPAPWGKAGVKWDRKSERAERARSPHWPTEADTKKAAGKKKRDSKANERARKITVAREMEDRSDDMFGDLTAMLTDVPVTDDEDKIVADFEAENTARLEAEKHEASAGQQQSARGGRGRSKRRSRKAKKQTRKRRRMRKRGTMKGKKARKRRTRRS